LFDPARFAVGGVFNKKYIMPVIDKITRNAAGVVLFLDASDNIIYTAAGGVLSCTINGTDTVRVQKYDTEFVVLVASLVTRLQVEPAAEVAFAGNAQALITELSTSFFFELSGGCSVGNDLFLFQNFN
jgi:hypothetical protein